MATIGILADNYKVERFKKELIKDGFTDFEVAILNPQKNGCTAIKVTTDITNQPRIAKICQRVEFHFKRAN